MTESDDLKLWYLIYKVIKMSLQVVILIKLINDIWMQLISSQIADSYLERSSTRLEITCIVQHITKLVHSWCKSLLELTVVLTLLFLSFLFSFSISYCLVLVQVVLFSPRVCVTQDHRERKKISLPVMLHSNCCNYLLVWVNDKNHSG